METAIISCGHTDEASRPRIPTSGERGAGQCIGMRPPPFAGAWPHHQSCRRRSFISPARGRREVRPARPRTRGRPGNPPNAHALRGRNCWPHMWPGSACVLCVGSARTERADTGTSRPNWVDRWACQQLLVALRPLCAPLFHS